MFASDDVVHSFFIYLLFFVIQEAHRLMGFLVFICNPCLFFKSVTALRRKVWIIFIFKKFFFKVIHMTKIYVNIITLRHVNLLTLAKTLEIPVFLGMSCDFLQCVIL